jgi:uncharacterized membrane protein HdeD (DUF308 family)
MPEQTSRQETIVDGDGEGWRVFAGVILLVAGLMRIFDAIWAFSSHAALPEGLEDAILGSNLKTYGWLYLVTAALLLVGGFLVFYRSQFGRWVGIIAGAFACVGAVTWLPYYPVWSLVYIGIGVLVIYALAAHGGRAHGALSGYPGG